MKAAVASDDGIHINLHFGHCESFYIYEITETEARLCDVRKTERFCTKESNHGTHNGVMEKFLLMLMDCKMILCESIGYKVAERFAENGIASFMLECDIEMAIEAWQNGTLDLITEGQNGNY